MGFPNNWYYGIIHTNSAFKFYNPNSPQYVEKIMDGHNNLLNLNGIIELVD
jgi:hypothetical protein